jgi:hypothetical protein
MLTLKLPRESKKKAEEVNTVFHMDDWKTLNQIKSTQKAADTEAFSQGNSNENGAVDVGMITAKKAFKMPSINMSMINSI